MKFSKFIKVFEFDEENVILLHTFNGAVALVRKNFLNGLENLSDDIIYNLNNMEFLDSDDEILAKEKHFLNNFITTNLKIIIELTDKCNFKCSYCYQNEWSKVNLLSEKNALLIIEYIKNVIKTHDYKELDIDFFGGEPLLQKDLILFLKREIDNLTKNNDIKVNYAITTNGYLLTSDFVSSFENLRIVTTISLPKDHNKKRLLCGDYKIGTLNKILNNLNSCKSLIDMKNIVLEIRYNTDDENISFFGEFLDFLKERGILAEVKTAYTFNHVENEYLNSLLYSEYTVWNSTVVIDELVKREMKVIHAPEPRRLPCIAYWGYNIKIFADGYIGLCNSFLPDMKKLRIEEIAYNPDKVLSFFEEKNKILTSKGPCLLCEDKFFCGGHTFCKDKPCKQGFVVPELFYKTYIKHAMNGKQGLFIFKY